MTDAVTGAAATGTTLIEGKSKGLEAMNGMEFLKLLITELTNQDPLDPMKNKELLDQLSTIRSLESDVSMTEKFSTLINQQKTATAAIQAMGAGQEMARAAELIGASITGVSTEGMTVEGRVERVVMDTQGVHVQIGEHTIPLANVFAIAGQEMSNG